jgi:hypothetical protein
MRSFGVVWCLQQSMYVQFLTILGQYIHNDLDMYYNEVKNYIVFLQEPKVQQYLHVHNNQLYSPTEFKI